MMTRKGFTLIELLVVIAIIALLLSIIMPGLNMVKKKAASIVCLSNVRQMSLGWYMYQEENEVHPNNAQVDWDSEPREKSFGAPDAQIPPPRRKKRSQI